MKCGGAALTVRGDTVLPVGGRRAGFPGSGGSAPRSEAEPCSRLSLDRATPPVEPRAAAPPIWAAGTLFPTEESSP